MRGDLVFSRQTSDRGTTLVVKDPASGRFFRFREIEAFIIGRLDGATELENIRAGVREQLGAPLESTALEEFVGRLRRLGLVEGADAPGPESSRGPRRLRGTPLYLRLRAFDPDRLFGRMLKRCRLFFTPGFLVLSGSVILAAAGLTASHWSEIGRDVHRLYNLPSLALAYATMLVVITAHEFAHGLTCKHFGGEVREVGFFLIFLQPAFYCNVSDAWLFPERSRRLWVTFAGAYFELFLWALATVAWWLTDPSEFVNLLALVVMVTSGIKTLFNLNPLIKLDGYYLLSDYLEVPNLRSRAFGYLADRVRRLWGSATRRIQSASAREQRIYLVYGALAWVYSLWLLSAVLIFLGRRLTDRYQAWGLGLFVALLGVMFERPLKAGAGQVLGRIAPARTLRPATRRLMRLAALAAVAAALGLGRMELRISGPFVVRPLRNADVRAEVAGIIEAVHADEGQQVGKGQVLATLSGRDYQADERMTRAELDEKRARLALLQAGARPEEIELARTQLAKAEERLQYAAQNLERVKTLLAGELIPRKEFEDARELAALRARERDEARDQLALVMAGSRKQEIEATEAEIGRLIARRRYLEDQLRLLSVASPSDGIIATPKLEEKVGQAVKPGDLIAKVYEMRTVEVEIAVPEQEIAEVAVGRKVVLKARAYPERSFEGTVAAIAPAASEPEDSRLERTVRVTTRLDNPALLLKPDMTGHAKIDCGERRLIDLAARRLVRFFKVEFWSWW